MLWCHTQIGLATSVLEGFSGGIPRAIHVSKSTVTLDYQLYMCLTAQHGAWAEPEEKPKRPKAEYKSWALSPTRPVHGRKMAIQRTCITKSPTAVGCIILQNIHCPSWGTILYPHPTETGFEHWPVLCLSVRGSDNPALLKSRVAIWLRWPRRHGQDNQCHFCIATIGASSWLTMLFLSL